MTSPEARVAASDWKAPAGELDHYGCAVSVEAPLTGGVPRHRWTLRRRESLPKPRHYGETLLRRGRIPLLQIPASESPQRFTNGALSAPCRRGQRMERAHGN